MSKTYSIKPLEWQESTDDDGSPRVSAHTIFSTLSIYNANCYDDDTEPRRPPEWKFGYCVDEYYDEGVEDVESIEAGKARATEWYLGRLTPALQEIS